MIFLIEYDRPEGKIVRFETFEDTERSRAEASRLERELSLHRQGINREVVLLQATSEPALRRTHRRYFETLGSIVRPMEDGAT